MEKAYSLKDLGAKISAQAKKDNGVEVAEEALELLGKAVYFGMKDWAKESAAMTENKVDDFLARFYDLADPYVLEQLNKISGAETPTPTDEPQA